MRIVGYINQLSEIKNLDLTQLGVILAAMICVLTIGVSGCTEIYSQPSLEVKPTSFATVQNRSPSMLTPLPTGFIETQSHGHPTLMTTPPPPDKSDHSTESASRSRVQPVIDDLANRLNTEPASIELVSVNADEFPAGDLGCPDPKNPSKPIDAIVSGQRVLLKFEDTYYEYHMRPGQIVYCGIR